MRNSGIAVVTRSGAVLLEKTYKRKRQGFFMGVWVNGSRH